MGLLVSVGYSSPAERLTDLVMNSRAKIKIRIYSPEKITPIEALARLSYTSHTS
jgi:hypothetical protein